MTTPQHDTQWPPSAKKPRRRRLYEMKADDPIVEAVTAATTAPAVAETAPPEEHSASDESLPCSERAPATIDSILRHHIWAAMAVALAPMPLIDLVALMTVQVNLARRLAQEYQVSFFEGSAKTLISALMGSLLPVTASRYILYSLFKFVPGIGHTVGAVTLPVLAGASTYAIGQVLIRHFSAGGTVQDMTPEDATSYYVRMFEHGKHVIAKWKKTQ